MKIQKIEIIEQPQNVFNLEVKKNHNFIIKNGYVMHNCIDAVRYSLEPVWRKKGQ